MQVGKSTEARRDILARFRATLGLVTLAIIVIALTGGWVATQSAVQPIRRLSSAVRRIIATGRTDERMPVATEDDAINELTQLFNAMLDRIEGLVRAACVGRWTTCRTTCGRRSRGCVAPAELALGAEPTSSATARRWPTASRSRTGCW